MRWLGFFAVGTALPSLYATLPAAAALALTVALVVGLLMLMGWAAWYRHHFIPAGVGITITIAGLIFSITTLIKTNSHEPRNPAQPVSETGVDA